MRLVLRARVPPSRASHTAAGARFSLTEARLSTAAVNLTQMDSPLTRKCSPCASFDRPRLGLGGFEDGVSGEGETQLRGPAGVRLSG